ncbi:phosphorylase family protein [Actinorugispora endophytica]|uniref:purine-nucleoside phosphorylase n=1 Tax=Actinorugispora endophytica TaxID=1605990 RepID=A0A4R6UE40_9ACTN|nr:purine-nucleoside phosphorylase [Actinorugispora endophytica]TDQ45030.1 purine-nucleoside phosphorylase [Actinorugispora endophytica]
MSESTQARLALNTTKAKQQSATAAEEILSRIGVDGFDAVVVLGAGFARAAEELGTAEDRTDLRSLPGFGPEPAALHSRLVGTKRVAVFTSPVHLFDGRGPIRVAHSVRTGIGAGARVVLLTDGVGSLRTDFAVGQPVLVRDHINLTGSSPLVGPDFVDLSHAYSPRLRQLARETDRSLAEGVYGAVRGPQLGTPAEVSMLRFAGADLVGASTVLETIAAVEMGAEVLGICLTTYDAVTPRYRPHGTEHLLGVADRYAPAVGGLIHSVLWRL